ncbi:transposase [Poseidonocella sp. HB161398]|uniref:transposase n=1 Tax=Poseidonocella sp. HB161398 TaxID=2320855 RepID=UPI0011086EDA|nr:transposase [Poseidonocella sp. HB161398]
MAGVRAILAARKPNRNSMIALEMPLRGLLRNFGLTADAISRGRFEARTRESGAGPTMLETVADPVLRLRATLRLDLAGLEKRVRHMACGGSVRLRLVAMPGAGAVAAPACRSAVDDAARLRSTKNAGPRLGRTPCRSPSGERDVPGRIAKAGDVTLGRALCRAATVMPDLGRGGALRTRASLVARRRGRKRATAALAGRMAVVMHRMGIDGTAFRMETAPTT